MKSIVAAFLVPLSLASANPAVDAVLEAAPRLDAPGPGYSGRLVVPAERIDFVAPQGSPFSLTAPAPWTKGSENIYLLSTPAPDALVRPDAITPWRMLYQLVPDFGW